MTVSRERPTTRCKNCLQPMVELAYHDHRTGHPVDDDDVPAMGYAGGMKVIKPLNKVKNGGDLVSKAQKGSGGVLA